MRTSASWTAKTALLAVRLRGPPGAACPAWPSPVPACLAAHAPQTPASDPDSGNVAGSGNVSADQQAHSPPSGQPARGRLRLRCPVLGDSTAGCAGGALAGLASQQAAVAAAVDRRGRDHRGRDPQRPGAGAAALAAGPGPLGATSPLRGLLADIQPIPYFRHNNKQCNHPTDPPNPSNTTIPKPNSTYHTSNPHTPSPIPSSTTLTFQPHPISPNSKTLPHLSDLPSLTHLTNIPTLNNVTKSHIPHTKDNSKRIQHPKYEQ